MSAGGGPGETFDVEIGRCWACGAVIEAATSMENYTPGELEGQPAICVVCTRVSVFETSPLWGLRVVKPAADTLAYLEGLESVRAMQRMVYRAQENYTGRSAS